MNALSIARCATHARRVRWLLKLRTLYRHARIYGESAWTRAWGTRGEREIDATLAEWGETP